MSDTHRPDPNMMALPGIHLVQLSTREAMTFNEAVFSFMTGAVQHTVSAMLDISNIRERWWTEMVHHAGEVQRGLITTSGNNLRDYSERMLSRVRDAAEQSDQMSHDMSRPMHRAAE